MSFQGAQMPKAATTVHCGQCGTALPAGSVFCGSCGARQEDISAAAASTPPSPAVCPACGSPECVGGMFCGQTGQRITPYLVTKAPPGEPAPQAMPLAGSGVAILGPLRTWPFQEQTTRWAAQLVALLNQKGVASGAGFGAMLARMIRASLLDKQIYRELASNPALDSEALQVTVVWIVMGSMGGLLLALSTSSALNITALITSCIAQAVAWVVRVWTVQITAANWLKINIPTRAWFRSMTYAQSAAALGIVPVVGPLLGIWALVPNTAAARDITGTDTGKAVILVAAGLLAGMIAAAIVVSVLHMFSL